MHAQLPIAVVSVVIRNNNILLLKRKNTPWMNGYWGIPGGRLDAGESMTHGAIRELREETGLTISDENIAFKSIVQHKDERGERIYFIIQVVDINEEPQNREPEKCEDMQWFPLNNLPQNITPQVQIALDAIQNQEHYQEFGY
ncbi:MAG: NUDIX domain-containing protein [Candidatus Altimarinota bacterium]